MKKLLLFLLAATALAPCFAQSTSSRLGVTGGLSCDRLASFSQIGEKLKNGYHAGLLWQINLPAYFSLQPCVLYEQKNSTALLSDVTDATTGDVKTSSIVVPLSVQWGPDLGLFRLFVQAVPYANILLGAKLNSSQDVKDCFKDATFGCGVGGGLEIWQLQLSVRYNWDFGTWQETIASNPFKDLSAKRQGLNISLSLFFN